MANHRFGGNQGDPDAVFDGAQQVRDGVGFEDAPPMEARFLARDVDPCAERRVGAIPLDLLKSEQERIRTSLDQITRRLDTMTATYTGARDGLDELLVDLGDLYNRCEPAECRMLNRVLFDRIIIDEDANISVVPAEPAASVLAHVNTDVPEPVTAETNLPRTHAGQGSNI